MNDYETKKQARIDYYRDKADKARAESHDLYKQSSDMLSAIPPGQPLLVDHYSYMSDKRYRDRAAHKMEQSMEAMDKAAYYDQKAQAAENNTAISSDDPEAITKLKDKLDKLRNKQSLMKQVNAYYRKHQTCRGCDAISPERAAELDNSMANAYSWETAPFPAWALSNNNAEIRRIEKRIAVLEQKKETGFRGWEFDGGRVEANMDANRLQVFFDEIPPEDVRSALKSNGFHWARSAGAWQRQLTGNAIYAASRVKAICPSDGTDPRKLQPKAHPKEIER